MKDILIGDSVPKAMNQKNPAPPQGSHVHFLGPRFQSGWAGGSELRNQLAA